MVSALRQRRTLVLAFTVFLSTHSAVTGTAVIAQVGVFTMLPLAHTQRFVLDKDAVTEIVALTTVHD